MASALWVLACVLAVVHALPHRKEHVEHVGDLTLAALEKVDDALDAALTEGASLAGGALPGRFAALEAGGGTEEPPYWSAVKAAFGDAFAQETVEQPGQQAAALVAAKGQSDVGKRAVSLATLKKINTWLIKVMEARPGGTHIHSDDRIKACSTDPKQICMSDGGCAMNGGGECSERLLHDKDSADMNFINGVLVKPVTKFMFETTRHPDWDEAAKKKQAEGGWAWGDPRYNQAVGSFAEFVGCSTPDFFVSHNWGGAFAGFVAALQMHFNVEVLGKRMEKEGVLMTEETTFYWVCTFANNQHDAKHDLGDPNDASTSGFVKALDKAKQVVSVQHDTQFGSFTLYRAWCSFEFYWSITHDYPITFACASTAAAALTQFETNPAAAAAMWMCRPIVCERMGEYKTAPGSEDGKIVGTFATEPADYTLITGTIAATKGGALTKLSRRAISKARGDEGDDEEDDKVKLFEMAVHALAPSEQCDAGASRLEQRRNGISAVPGATEETRKGRSLADLIAQYPQLHPFLWNEAEHDPLTFRSIAELVAEPGKYLETTLMHELGVYNPAEPEPDPPAPEPEPA